MHILLLILTEWFNILKHKWKRTPNFYRSLTYSSRFLPRPSSRSSDSAAFQLTFVLAITKARGWPAAVCAAVPGILRTAGGWNASGDGKPRIRWSWNDLWDRGAGNWRGRRNHRREELLHRNSRRCCRTRAALPRQKAPSSSSKSFRRLRSIES